MTSQAKPGRPYKEVQFSWILAAFLIPAQILLALFYHFGIGDNPLSLQGFLAISALLVVIFLLFYNMTTVVTEDFVEVRFGMGLIRRKIGRSSIRSAEAVTTPWYYGYGIRWMPNGWLYNVSGPHGIELRFNDRRGFVRIGSKDPAGLRNAIRAMREGK